MPTVDKVTVSYGVTKNIGNYQSVRYEESVQAILVNDDKAGEVLDELRGYVKGRVNAGADELAKEYNERK